MDSGEETTNKEMTGRKSERTTGATKKDRRQYAKHREKRTGEHRLLVEGATASVENPNVVDYMYPDNTFQCITVKHPFQNAQIVHSCHCQTCLNTVPPLQFQNNHSQFVHNHQPLQNSYSVQQCQCGQCQSSQSVGSFQNVHTFQYFQCQVCQSNQRIQSFQNAQILQQCHCGKCQNAQLNQNVQTLQQCHCQQCQNVQPIPVLPFHGGQQIARCQCHQCQNIHLTSSIQNEQQLYQYNYVYPYHYYYSNPYLNSLLSYAQLNLPLPAVQTNEDQNIAQSEPQIVEIQESEGREANNQDEQLQPLLTKNKADLQNYSQLTEDRIQSKRETAKDSTKEQELAFLSTPSAGRVEEKVKMDSSSRKFSANAKEYFPAVNESEHHTSKLQLAVGYEKDTFRKKSVTDMETGQIQSECKVRASASAGKDKTISESGLNPHSQEFVSKGQIDNLKKEITQKSKRTSLYKSTENSQTFIQSKQSQVRKLDSQNKFVLRGSSAVLIEKPHRNFEIHSEDQSNRALEPIPEVQLFPEDRLGPQGASSEEEADVVLKNLLPVIKMCNPIPEDQPEQKYVIRDQPIRTPKLDSQSKRTEKSDKVLKKPAYLETQLSSVCRSSGDSEAMMEDLSSEFHKIDSSYNSGTGLKKHPFKKSGLDSEGKTVVRSVTLLKEQLSQISVLDNRNKSCHKPATILEKQPLSSLRLDPQGESDKESQSILSSQPFQGFRVVEQRGSTNRSDAVLKRQPSEKNVLPVASCQEIQKCGNIPSYQLPQGHRVDPEGMLDRCFGSGTLDQTTGNSELITKHLENKNEPKKELTVPKHKGGYKQHARPQCFLKPNTDETRSKCPLGKLCLVDCRWIGKCKDRGKHLEEMHSKFLVQHNKVRILGDNFAVLVAYDEIFVCYTGIHPKSRKVCCVTHHVCKRDKCSAMFQYRCELRSISGHECIEDTRLVASINETFKELVLSGNCARFHSASVKRFVGNKISVLFTITRVSEF